MEEEKKAKQEGRKKRKREREQRGRRLFAAREKRIALVGKYFKKRDSTDPRGAHELKMQNLGAKAAAAEASGNVEVEEVRG
jgi:hypothetical protein